MTPHTEVELRFAVPATSRRALLAELSRGEAARVTLAAMYLDTPDRRLARDGIAWRLRREGRRWMQTLKGVEGVEGVEGGAAGPLERFEHEVLRPEAVPDAALHAGTPVGERLLALLRQARDDGLAPEVRFRTDIRRRVRRVRTRGAVVDVAFDEGRLVAGSATQPVRELEFELVSGAPLAMLALAQRWRRRFGLVLEPRSKAERGDRLALGTPAPALRKAARPRCDRRARAMGAFVAVLDECLAQVLHNAVGVVQADSPDRAEPVHQLRIGIRRLRSALRAFDGWVPPAPQALVEALRALFDTLGRSRDSEVLGSGVGAQLAALGDAPPLPVPHGDDERGQDAAAAVSSDAAQAMLLGWIAWRVELAAAPVAVATDAPGDGGAKAFRRDVRRRLRRWHRRIVADAPSFDALDEAALHALRKRIKRQRYAVEFFGAVLKDRAAARYLDALCAIQALMGELNDLLVARQRYQALVEERPAAWFALGWLAARIAQVRALAKPALERLARIDPPR